jgi:hypothetical protein
MTFSAPVPSPDTLAGPEHHVGALYSCAFRILKTEGRYRRKILNIKRNKFDGTVLADIMARVGEGLTRWSYGECQ